MRVHQLIATDYGLTRVHWRGRWQWSGRFSGPDRHDEVPATCVRRDRATLPMTMPAAMPISGVAVAIAVICGCKVKVDAGASAIRGVAVIIRRIGVGLRVPRVGPVAGVAPIWGGSQSSGVSRCGCGNSRHRQRTCDRQNNRNSSHSAVLLLGAVWRTNSEY
jgi:hypothetical protein